MVKISKVYLVSVLLTHGAAQKSCKQPHGTNCFEPCLICDANSIHGVGENPWEWWKLQYNKTYDTAEEEAYHHGVWEMNTEYMIMTNEENSGFSLGWNSESDLTRIERIHVREGAFDTNSSLTDELGATYRGELRHEGKVTDLPSDWDWSTTDVEVVTYVKHQHCGDCWAFSAAATLEGALAVGNGWTTSLSPQQFVDCSDAGSCDGGNKRKAMDWAKDNFACSMDSYKETGQDGSCNWNCDQVITAGSIWGTYKVTPYDEGSLCMALLQRPIAISVATGDSFHHYKGGILSDAYPSKTSHAIVAVGYGYWDGTAYWKVKNSWGTSWGIDGYALLYRGGDSDQNLIMSAPYGVYVYGPYNPSMQLTSPAGLRVSAPTGPAPTFTVQV